MVKIKKLKSNLKVCFVRHGFFPQDVRVAKEVNMLHQNGFDVDIICLRKPMQKRFEIDGKINILRLPLAHKRTNMLRYVVEYGISWLLVLTIVTFKSFRNRYDCIQVNTLPDFMVFAALTAKWMGAKVLLDLHEPTPELWLTRFGNAYRLVYKILVALEQAAIRFCDQAYTVTETLKRRYIHRGADSRKIIVIPNVCEEDKFRTSTPVGDYPVREAKPFTVITHGTIEERYGHEVLVDAVNNLKSYIPNLKLVIIGEGAFKENIVSKVRAIGLQDIVEFYDYLPFPELLSKLRTADVGINAMYRNPYSELIDTNKMYEYIEMRIPVVNSQLPAVQESFDDSCMMLFNPGDHHDLARCIQHLYKFPEKRRELAQNAYKRYEQKKWSVTGKVYLASVKKLLPPMAVG